MPPPAPLPPFPPLPLVPPDAAALQPAPISAVSPLSPETRTSFDSSERLSTSAMVKVSALLPVPPVALAMRAIMRYIRDADELQRRIELEALSFSTAWVSLAYLAGGFLQRAQVIDIPSGVAMIWVFPLICIGYGVVKLAIARRFS